MLFRSAHSSSAAFFHSAAYRSHFPHRCSALSGDCRSVDFAPVFSTISRSSSGFSSIGHGRRWLRLNGVRLIKAFPLTLNGLRDFNEAIITKGGVRVSEVNPSTMESKLVRHLYFCGEVLDLDALTGGFNLQIAWSTGHLAGMCVE